MAKYKVVRCPYCTYIWPKRGESQPVSCPRCKKRFDYPGNRKILEEEEVISFDIRGWLVDANRISFGSESLGETMEKLED